MEKKSIVCEMNKETFDKVNEISKIKCKGSKSDAIALAVSLAHILIQDIEAGSKIIIEKKNGSQKELKF